MPRKLLPLRCIGGKNMRDQHVMPRGDSNQDCLHQFSARWPLDHGAGTFLEQQIIFIDFWLRL